MKTHKRKFNGSKLNELRVDKGMKLEEVATMLSVDPSTVSLWENAQRQPEVSNLKKISEFFKVPIKSLFVSLVIIAIPFCLMTSLAYADVSRADGIRAIVGEAANQPAKYGDQVGFDGMTAVGEVIRRRGSVRGLYGYKAMETRKESEAVWAMAGKAWDRSASSTLTYDEYSGKGATLFENINAFGFPKSWDRMKVIGVKEIGDHVFFVEV